MCSGAGRQCGPRARNQILLQRIDDGWWELNIAVCPQCVEPVLDRHSTLGRISFDPPGGLCITILRIDSLVRISRVPTIVMRKIQKM